MWQPVVLILADNIDNAQLQADGLKHRSIESQIRRFGAQTGTVTLPKRYNLVLIDSMYSGEAALTLLRQIRNECATPIVLVTHELDVRYQLAAYEAGVDECIVQPISAMLLLAKISVWLRQQAATTSEAEQEDPCAGAPSRNTRGSRHEFALDPKSRRVTTVDGFSVKLSILEFRLFQIFLANEGRVLETNQLLSKVWLNYDEVDARLLTNLVYRLRQKLYAEPFKRAYIRKVDRIGYVFE